MSQTDPLHDVLAALIRAGLDAEKCRTAVAGVRGLWGGARCYIQAIDRQERDEKIRSALEHGLTVKDAARRAATSAVTVRRRRSEWL